MKIIAKITYVAVVLVLVSCSNNKKADKEKDEQLNFINPAFKEFNIPFEEFSFDSQSGDTIFCENGTILLFPPSSFVDNKGNIIKGKVNISYREFSNPIDFFVSGIPMNYDSANTKYFFESAGMCEIYATKENVPVFVNPENKPEVNLVSNNKGENFNLYYLDTLQKKWINNINNIPADVIENSKAKIKYTEISNQSLVPPIKPSKSDSSKPIIEIDVAKGSVAELQAYNNMKFEIVNGIKSSIKSDTDTEWEDIKLKKGDKPGTYNAIFIKGKKKTSYLVRPVFEGKSYEEALKVFEIKQIEYEQLKEKRKENEKLQNEKIAKENERISKLNLLIEARNKVIDKRNKEILNEIKKANEAKQVRIEEHKKQLEKEEKEAFKNGGEAMNSQVIRTFYLERFGVWNCDHPILQSGVSLYSKFKDYAGNEIHFSKITLVNKSFNGLFALSNPNIKVNPKIEYMIWSIQDNKFLYMTFDDFKNCKIDSTTKEYTFSLRSYPGKISSRNDIKKIVGI
jgi:hypothetical protein